MFIIRDKKSNDTVAIATRIEDVRAYFYGQIVDKTTYIVEECIGDKKIIIDNINDK